MAVTADSAHQRKAGRGDKEEGTSSKSKTRSNKISPAFLGLVAFGIFAFGAVVFSGSGLQDNNDRIQKPVAQLRQVSISADVEESSGNSQESSSESSEASEASEASSDLSPVPPAVVETRPEYIDPYPFYKINLDDGNEPWAWPGVGWAKDEKLTVEDSEFVSNFKFYMLEDGPFDMSEAEKCFRHHVKISADDYHDPNNPHLLDQNLRLNQRQYLAELNLWPVLRKHKMRTMDPEKASMFFIGYSPYLAHQSYPCDKIRRTRVWEAEVAEALKNSKYWQKNQGRDHFLFYMKYNIMMEKPLQDLLDSGVNALTTDRHYWSISHNLPKTFQDGRVLVIPYICSTFLDSPYASEDMSIPKDPNSYYMFFGNLRRRFGGRSWVMELAQFLEGTNFQGTELPRSPIPDVLNRTAHAMRQSRVCLCPSGDAPTSVRVFEALGSGCLPIVMGYKEKMHTDMPFPSLIDWDSVALFTLSLETITKRSDGLQNLAKSFEEVAGHNITPERRKRIDKMLEDGGKLFRNTLMYRRNPQGITINILFEAWILLQKKGIISGRFSN